ncbi:helix-turn-helix transcriptional regulator [Pontibacter rugosus]|uniref:Helix-turn-helix transcriptional regulator n=1 Tax=Pontibacter rugosus TaxID=1745966 RepID=A0ABW3SKA7_9BACT
MGYIRKEVYKRRLGERIAELRNARSWSQEELGARIGGRDRQSINRIEKGLHDPGSFLLVEMAEAFGMTFSQLVDFDYSSID